MSAENTKPKRTRRSKEEVEAEKTAKAAAKAEKDAAKAAASNGEEDKPSPAAAPVIGSDGLKSAIRIQNSSQNILVIPISDSERKILNPVTSWAVPDSLAAKVKEILRSPYYEALIGLGHLRVHDVQPSRLGELELKAPQTPEPPKDLVEKPEHITQAEFVETDAGE